MISAKEGEKKMTNASTLYNKTYLCYYNNSHGFMNHWIKQPREKLDHLAVATEM